MFVSQFGQAGAERFAFEIDRAIDRDKFDVHILCRFPLKGNEDWEDHYYKLHLQNGSSVSFLRPQFLGRLRASIRHRLYPRSLKNITSLNKSLNKQLGEFDVIIWMGEYMFNGLGAQVSDDILDKSLIYIMSSKAQTSPDDYYANYDKTRSYKFISAFETEASVEHELGSFPHYQHHYFPLCFEPTADVNKWRFNASKPAKRIGIFTRLSHQKPLDPFFYAFHLLLDKFPDVELHIFGSGDPTASGAARFAQNIHIQDKVKFRGHVADISAVAVAEDLDLIWFQAMHGMPGGFAGYELCLTGIPQIYWEIVSPGAEVNPAYPVFSKLSDFVATSEQMLNDKNAAELQSAQQFEVTLESKDIKRWIPKLEDLVLSVAGKQRLSN